MVTNLVIGLILIVYNVYCFLNEQIGHNIFEIGRKFLGRKNMDELLYNFLTLKINCVFESIGISILPSFFFRDTCLKPSR